jgi:hypothetical protein
MPLEHDAAYDCPYCGEENHVGIDATGGAQQRFTEDCPVCCSPIAFTVRVDRSGDPHVESVERDE